MVVELAHLTIAHLIDDVAGAYRQVAAADTMRGFDNRAGVTRPLQLVRRRQPGESGAKDDDVAQSTVQLGNAGHGCGLGDRGNEAEPNTGLIDRARTAGSANPA